MERIIWLLTFVPASMLLVVTGGIDFYLLTVMQEKGILENSILGNTSFLVTIAVIVLIAAIVQINMTITMINCGTHLFGLASSLVSLLLQASY